MVSFNSDIILEKTRKKGSFGFMTTAYHLCLRQGYSRGKATHFLEVRVKRRVKGKNKIYSSKSHPHD